MDGISALLNYNIQSIIIIILIYLFQYIICDDLNPANKHHVRRLELFSCGLICKQSRLRN
jgi:hypothetical protein